MPLIVQKYGGSSVGTLERIESVAKKIIASKEKGHHVVVVLSAMQGETDRLISLAHSITQSPKPREYDALVSLGEQISTALMGINLESKGYHARSYTGTQAGIVTNNIHGKARIDSINTEALKKDLYQGIIPIVAGFQGVDLEGNVTTLGRGGSDTTAVALAAALNADECQIYTDVAGVYTSDPRIITQARLLDHITFEEMLELASLGAKVLQIRSVEFAGKYNVPLRVLSSFEEGPGTLITYEDPTMEQPLVSGIAMDRNQAKITVLGIPHQPRTVTHVFGAVSDKNIDVDMIVQNVPSPNERIDISFTVTRNDFKSAMQIMEALSRDLGGQGVTGDDTIAKLSIVGVGMRSHTGVAKTMFEALGDENIPIHLITTSEIRLSVVIDEKYLELGARALHSAFGLDTSQH